MLYTILNKIEWPVRIKSTLLKTKGNWSATIVKFQSLWSSGYACSMVYPAIAYSNMVKDMKKKTQHTFQKVTVKLNIPCYKIITWDDIEKDSNLEGHVYEIMRKDDKPMIFDTINMFVNLDGHARPSVEEILEHEYRAINHPSIGKYISYNSREEFKQMLKKKQEIELANEEEEYREWKLAMSGLCNIEENYDDPRDWSEEEQVMNALENGNGEYFGF